MVRRPPARSTIAIVIGLFVAFAVWTWLSFSWPPLADLDQRSLAPASTTPHRPPRNRQCMGAADLARGGVPGCGRPGTLGVPAQVPPARDALILIIPLGWGIVTPASASSGRGPSRAGSVDVDRIRLPFWPTTAIVATTIAVGATSR